MNINKKISTMTLEEKVGQKIMMDFRYWNPPGQGHQDMTVPNDDIKATIIDNHIGGVILFADIRAPMPQHDQTVGDEMHRLRHRARK